MARSGGVDASQRKHLEGVRRRLERQLDDGDTGVLKRLQSITEQLEGPPVPPALQYLKDWSDQLLGRSGVGMDGYAPLSPTVVRDWAYLKRLVVLPHEFDALVMLDDCRRNPPKETDDG